MKKQKPEEELNVDQRIVLFFWIALTLNENNDFFYWCLRNNDESFNLLLFLTATLRIVMEQGRLYISVWAYITSTNGFNNDWNTLRKEIGLQIMMHTQETHEWEIAHRKQRFDEELEFGGQTLKQWFRAVKLYRINFDEAFSLVIILCFFSFFFFSFLSELLRMYCCCGISGINLTAKAFNSHNKLLVLFLVALAYRFVWIFDQNLYHNMLSWLLL